MEHQDTILIVDDEEKILNTYRNFFVKRGFAVEIADDGAEGLEKLRTGKFDVAIVDLRMPEMDGIEMIREANKEGIDTDFIILTGHGDKDDAVAAINIGYWAVGGWFEKSGINMDELLARVKKLIDGIPLEEVGRILSVIPEEDLQTTL